MQIFKQNFEEKAVLFQTLLPGKKKKEKGNHFRLLTGLSTFQLQFNGFILMNARFRAASRRLIRVCKNNSISEYC